MHMAANKGTGYDGVPRKGVKLFLIVNPTKLYEILDRRFENPDNNWLHISKLFYLYKNKKKLSESDLLNFRPIAVLSAFEVAIIKWIYECIYEKSDFIGNIFSFIKGRST